MRRTRGDTTKKITWHATCRYRDCKYKRLYNYPEKLGFSFPKKRVAQWCDNIGYPEYKLRSWNAVKTWLVCEEHFRPEDFTNTLRNRLNWNVLPIPYVNSNELDTQNTLEESSSSVIDVPGNSLEQTCPSSISQVCTSHLNTVSDKEQESDHNLIIKSSKQKHNNTPHKSNNSYLRSLYANDSSKTNTIISADNSDQKVELKQEIVQTVKPSNLNKQKMLFRRLCTTLLHLPSPKWGIHVHPEYLNICKVVKFSVERGICISDKNSKPEIQINGRTIELENFKEVKSIKEIEHLISLVDQINLCPGTGLKDFPASPNCAGEARLSDTQEYISCVACHSLKLLTIQQEQQQKVYYGHGIIM